MRAFIFEGTAEEIVKVVQTTRLAPMTATETVSPAVSFMAYESDEDRLAEGSEPKLQTRKPSLRFRGMNATKFVTVEFACHVLTRRPLAERQKVVFETLYNTEPGEFVPAAILREATDYDAAQFSGLMGALGRRIARTPGHDKGAVFFETERDEATREWKYRLPQTVREAVRIVILG